MRRLLTFIVLIAHSQPLLAATWFVNATAQGQNSGGSWDDAFLDLQDALDVAQAGDEIWVASGTYKPDRGTGDRTISFVMVPGVPLYGGFAGWESSLNERDWRANPTVLSGDLNGDDGPRNCALVSDCCREHEGFGCDNPACEARVCSQRPECCEGFCPECLGDWDRTCAGLALAACCDVGDWGTCENSYLILDATTPTNVGYFLDGFTVQGGYIRGPEAYQTPGGYGLYSADGEVVVQNSTFHNHSQFAIRLHASSAIFSNCTIAQNLGVGVYYPSSNLSLIDCAFFDNGQGASGGGIGTYQTTVINSTFAEHRGNALQVGGDLSVTDSFFSGGGAVSVSQSNGQANFENCIWTGNAGVLANYASSTIMRNCVILGTHRLAISSGFASNNFTNCLFANGAHSIGQGYGTLKMTNCVVAGNEVEVGNATGLNLNNVSATLKNSIFWGNRSSVTQQGLLEQGQIDEYESNINIDHCLVEGWTGKFGGFANSGLDPLFVNVPGVDGVRGTLDDNFRLSPNSAAINAGDTAVITLPPTDLDGHHRVLCGAVDIGAYEFGIGDFNCDQSIDLLDQAIWNDCMTNPRPSAVRPGCEAFDFNADSDIDLSDFAAQQRILISP